MTFASKRCRAVLKRWDMSSATHTVETYQPDHPRCFEAWITAHIGPADGDGEEMFQFRVTTPDYLALTMGAPQWMRHTLLVELYDPAAIRKALVDHLATIDGQDWNEVGPKVGRIAFWEFEDYVPFVESSP